MISISKDQGTCRARFNVDILYLSEDDAFCGGSCTAEAVCEIPLADECIYRLNCRPIGEASAVAVTGGLEVRFDAEFSWLQTKETECGCVSAVTKSTENDCSSRPSVVIRRAVPSESLWDIAKACGSTVKDICRANGLASDILSESTTLLIPTRRT